MNGSGLARSNTASPKQVAELLVYMRKEDAEKRAFYDSLAIAGETGTLSDRMRNTAAEGRCHAKTGTIDGVSALSGYCRADGGHVAFSILMNNVSIDAAGAPRTRWRPRSPATADAPRPGSAREQLLEAASSITSTPRSSAFASFEPGLSPATT